MKNIVLILLIGLFIYSCEDDFQRTKSPTESVPPSAVTNVRVKNVNGGAVIHYDVPKDEDLSYVKAVYERKPGQFGEAKASRFVDSLVIEGYGDVSEKSVKLIAVDRNSNESAPLVVTVNPLAPPVDVIAESFNVIADFGGITADWENSDNQEVGIVFLRKDTVSDRFDLLETYYTDGAKGKRSIRNMPVKERTFGVYIKDRWDNRSDTLYYDLTPIFETDFDKGLFKRIILPGEYEGVFGWVHEKMWDGEYGGGNGYSSPGGTGVWPHTVTFDMGIEGKLSRLQLKQRTEPFVFAEGNLRRFEVFGATELNADGEWDGWTLLGDFESIKPSGLPMGQNSNEDIQRAHEGEDFIFDINLPKVRYIRIKVKETWAAGDNFQISELTIFGDNRQNEEGDEN